MDAIWQHILERLEELDNISKKQRSKQRWHSEGHPPFPIKRLYVRDYTEPEADASARHKVMHFVTNKIDKNATFEPYALPFNYAQVTDSTTFSDTILIDKDGLWLSAML